MHQAGGLLNLSPVLGTGVGVAGTSAVLSWRLATPTGIAVDADCLRTSPCSAG
jgi:hypothetical protein